MITDEQIAASVSQLQAMKGRARSGSYRDIASHNAALDGMALALTARNGGGLRAHAERLDSAAAYCFEGIDGPHRRIAVRAIQISRLLEEKP